MLWIDFVQHIPDADPPETAVVARVVLEPGQLNGLIERLTAVREKSSLPPPGSKGRTGLRG
jgi:hypothetical protein